MTSVRAANAAFYQAFEQQDLEAMSRVWKQTGDVRCTHPGEAPIRGWAAVRASWAQIFDASDLFRIRITDLSVREESRLAVVACVELITAVAGGEAVEGAVAATNVFERLEDGWRMVCHHGSGFSVRPATLGMPAPKTVN